MSSDANDTSSQEVQTGADSAEDTNNNVISNNKPKVISWPERIFRSTVFLSFFWIMLGVCFIYGVHLWHDSPLHSSFMPIVFVSFSVVTSFIVVMTLNYVVGDIDLQVPGFTFKGAAGPIILWVLCFLAIVTGLSAVAVEPDKQQQTYSGTPLQELLFP